MGLRGSKSKAEIETLASEISNIAESSVQSCVVSANQNQNLDITNSGISLWGSYSAAEKTAISSSCFSDINRQTNLQNQIYNAVSQKTTSDGIAFLGAFGSSYSTAGANLRSIIKNNITLSAIQKQYTDINQNQSARYINTGLSGYSSVNLNAGESVFSAAVLRQVSTAGIFSAISNHIDQTSAAKTESPMQFLVDFFTQWVRTIVFAVGGIIAVIIFIVIGARLFSSAGASGPVSQNIQQDNLAAKESTTGLREDI